MANIPSIPPLFCSTPPPIDFGDEYDDDSALPPTLALDEEDDDDFGDFAVISQSNDDKENADVPSLPHTPVHLESCSSTTTSGFDDMQHVHDNKNMFATSVSPVEAFNLAILESSTPPPLDLDETITDIKDDADEEEKYKNICIDSTGSDPGETGFDNHDEKSVDFDTKDEDNVSLPSLKLDTLSLASEKQSACSSLAEEDAKVDEITNQEEDNKTKELSQPNNFSTLPYEYENSNILPCIVKLEDLEDDSSDDECYSPKKRKNIEANETSEDFFAIYAVADFKKTSTVEIVKPVGLASQEMVNCNENIKNSELESAKEDEFDDFTEFADFQSTPLPTPPQIDEFVDLDTKESQLTKPEFVFKADFSQLNALNENLAPKIEAKNEEILHTISKVEDFPQNINVVDDEDEFDDFQDFSAAPMRTLEESKKENTIAESVIYSSIAAIEKTIESEDDDEFGDFEEAQFSSASVPPKVSVTVPSADISQSPVCISNLNDRLKTILGMMFPSVVCEAIDENSNDMKSGAKNDQSILKFDSIDTAKALNYQWISSEVRHSLIKSLGIDSRNILYGEKWNSSMPRFAANLSFNPLEPMKPQQVSHSITSAESSHSNPLNERSTNTVKTDVPAVEFDWNSSGLVNPLDGPKESTYTRETETIHQTQSGQFDATIEQQQQTFAAFTNDDDDNSKLAVHATAAYTNTTTATSTILNPTTTATLSSIISTVSISNDIDDGNTTGDNNINLNENQYKTAESLKNDPNVYKSIDKETDNHNTDEVITTSTFSGPLKETHIYTPSKSEAAISKTTAVTKTTPIDFDYEIAAAGIIIDETVIKKEYRDIVYNPGFNLELNSSSRAQQESLGGGGSNRPVMNNFLESAAYKAEICNKNDDRSINLEKLQTIDSANVVCSEFDDEFSDFQSVPPLPMPQAQIHHTTVMPKTTKDIVNNSSCSNSRTSTPTFGGGNEMILCPAILLPQAISMESNSKPKIVWGDTTANINPDELARIEELFPQPKISSAKNPTDAMQHNSQRNTPTRSIAINGYQQQKQQTQKQQQLSISASIAQKELNVDDDDWTEFVSVPVDSKTPNFANVHNNNNQSNNLIHPANNRSSIMPPVQRLQQQKHHQWQQPAKIEAPLYKTNINEKFTNHTNDEEWSDFVSGTPAAPSVQLRSATSMLPQFNSAAWQNANFYNNPLSFYQSQHQKNVVPKLLQNNNSSANNYNNNYQQYHTQQLQQQQQHQQQQHFQLQQQQQHQQQSRQQQLQLQQQIHIMQDFSTAPPYNRTLNVSASAMSGNVAPANNNLQFQLGSAKVAPSISLIPDLGFVAPAAPTHTAFINSLPKPSFSTNTKK